MANNLADKNVHFIQYQVVINYKYTKVINATAFAVWPNNYNKQNFELNTTNYIERNVSKDNKREEDHACINNMHTDFCVCLTLVAVLQSFSSIINQASCFNSHINDNKANSLMGHYLESHGDQIKVSLHKDISRL